MLENTPPIKPIVKKGPTRRTRGKNKATLKIKNCITEAFENSGGTKYLERVAKKDYKTFCGLLAKIVPAELNVSGSVLIDLGTAMQEAEARTLELEASRHKVIDVTASSLELGATSLELGAESSRRPVSAFERILADTARGTGEGGS